MRALMFTNLENCTKLDWNKFLELMNETVLKEKKLNDHLTQLYKDLRSGLLKTFAILLIRYQETLDDRKQNQITEEKVEDFMSKCLTFLKFIKSK